MAYVTEWKDTDLGADGGSRGSFAIYNYTPILQYHLNSDGADRLYWWINGGKITANPNDNGDPDKINANSNFTVNFSPTNNGSTSKFIDGNGKDQQTITGTHNLNLITPFSPSISGNLGSTTTKPTGGTDTAFSVRMRFENRPVIGYWEGLDATLSGTLYDNTFCKNLSSVSIDRGYASGAGGIVIKMSSATPALQRSTDEEIVCTNKTYTVPCFSGSRTYRLSSSYGTPKNNGDENMVSVNLSGIKLYNDNITINCSSLGSIKTFSISGKTLSWTGVSGATKYNIYIDNNASPYTSVTTNSWTIPDSLYYNQKHTYHVEVCDVISLSYSYKTASGYKKVNSSWQPIDYITYNCLRQTNITAKKGHNKATDDKWKEVGFVNNPTVIRNELAPNKFQYVVSGEYDADAVNFYYSEGQTGNKVLIQNNTVTFDKLKVNVKKDYYFWTKLEKGSAVWWSDGYSYSVTPSIIAAPSITGEARTGINSYNISYSTSKYATSYNAYLNGRIFKANVGNPVNIVGWTANSSNIIKIEAVYGGDTSYNNYTERTYGADKTPLLTTPVLTKENLTTDNYEQEFGDAGSKEIIDNVVNRVKLSWTSVQYATGYIITDNARIWNNDTQKYEPTTIVDREDALSTSKIIDPQTDIRGYHNYTVQAITSVDETYNSRISNEISLNQEFPLPAPVISHTANSTEFTILQPLPDEEKGITQEAIDNIDFYSIQLVPSDKTTHSIFKSFTPGSYPYTYSMYDMVKDLDATETYTASVFARSYNAFYFHPSADSNNFTVKVVKLNQPLNLDFDPETSTAIWLGDPNAYQYEVNIKPIDKEKWITTLIDAVPGEVQCMYDFGYLAPNVYSIYVRALRDDTNKVQPIYLDSDISEVKSFGTMQVPTTFKRYVNKFTWDDVGADRYIFYEWKTVPDNTGNWDITYDENGQPHKVLNQGHGAYEPESLVTADGGALSLYLGMVDGAPYRVEPGKHIYSVIANSNIKGQEFTSNHSDLLEVEVEWLKKPNASFIDDSSIVHWDTQDTFVVYDTRVNGTAEKDDSADTSYTLDKDEAGTYIFTVRAISTRDEFLYQTSEWSDELTYNVYKLNRTTVSIHEKDDASGKFVFIWDEIPNATDYYININKDGELYREAEQKDRLYEFYLTESGIYSIYIVGKNYELLKNPKYIDSEISNMKKFGALSAPVGTGEDGRLDKNENIISWKNNPLVDYYEIYNYGKKYSETDRNMFEIDVTKAGTYSITVVACSLDDDINNSLPSKSIYYEVIQLPTPAGVRILEGDYLSFGLVDRADGYRIYIDNELAAITNNTKFNLTDFLSVRAGVLKIHVVAFSNQINILNSNPSNYVLKRIEKEKKFNIVINNITYDQIQLPFSMNFTLDETLDTAGITLAYIDEKHPFEKLTPADILIYESAGAARRFPMVIEKDEVSEIKVGNKIKYKHYLQLIERTILLQNEIIPDFSVSSSVADLLFNYDFKVSPDIGNNVAVSNKKTIGFGTYDNIPLEELGEMLMGGVIVNLLQDLNVIPEFDFTGIPDDFDWNIPTGFVWFKGVVPKGEINAIINQSFHNGETITLPNPTTRLSCFCISVRQILNWVLNIIGLDDIWDTVGSVGTATFVTVVFWEKLFKALAKGIPKLGKAACWIIAVICFLLEYIIYIVKILCGVRGYSWDGLLEKLMTTDLSIIGDCFYTDNDWAYPARKYYLRDRATGKVELIREFPVSFDPGTDVSGRGLQYTFQKSGNYDIILEIPELNLHDVYQAGLIDFDSSVLGGGKFTTLPTVNFMKDANGDPTTFRVEWKDLYVTKEEAFGTYLKISDVLNKVVSLTNNKYTIDPAIINLTSNLNCPDMTFSNGNYLYDVLETIGREFYGIPRLLEDNIITFDVLDKNTFADRQLSFWTDTDVLGTEYQDLDQVASGFISRVSNMIPDEDVTIYPAPGMWSTPRSDNKDVAASYVQSFAIAVDKPIYRINKVFVKNAIVNAPDAVLDITNYIYQDMVYQSLNDNNKGKGIALCWKQGDKFIRGLGQLPEASKFYKMMKWNETDYVIDKIVKDYAIRVLKKTQAEMTNNVNKPGDMLFQVEYEGYADTTLYIENPDKKNSKYSMYSVFNQEDNTISDTRFGGGALTVLKRHNTNMIQKEYQSYSLLRLPLLGDSLNVSNCPYYIDNLTYEFSNSYTKATCNFSKNYNKINPRTAVNSEYRQYELRSDTVVDRVFNFNEYCIIGNNENIVEEISSVNNWKNVVKDALTGNNHVKPECFYVNCYSDEDLHKVSYMGTEIRDFDDNNDPEFKLVTKYIDGIALPLSYNRIGMSVSFSANMADNFTAGYTLIPENVKKDNLERVQGFVRYVGDDSLNQLPYMRVTLGSMSSYVKNYSYKTKDGNGKDLTISVADTFPGVPWLEQPTVSLNEVCFSKFIKPHKDQREAFRFNYQMHFISNRDDVFLHKGFTKYLFRSPSVETHKSRPVLVGYVNDITNRELMDGPNTVVDGNLSVSQNSILFDKFKATNNYKGLALIWPDTKEILLEIRKPIKNGETVSVDPIYFNFTNKIKR